MEMVQNKKFKMTDRECDNFLVKKLDTELDSTADNINEWSATTTKSVLDYLFSFGRNQNNPVPFDYKDEYLAGDDRFYDFDITHKKLKHSTEIIFTWRLPIYEDVMGTVSNSEYLAPSEETKFRLAAYLHTFRGAVRFVKNKKEMLRHLTDRRWEYTLSDGGVVELSIRKSWRLYDNALKHYPYSCASFKRDKNAIRFSAIIPNELFLEPIDTEGFDRKELWWAICGM